MEGNHTTLNGLACYAAFSCNSPSEQQVWQIHLTATHCDYISLAGYSESSVYNENANERHFILGNICLCNRAAHEKRIRLWKPACNWWSISLKHTLVCLFMCAMFAPCLWIIKPTSHWNCQHLADWFLSAAICMIVLVSKKIKMKVCAWKQALVSSFILFSLGDKLMLSTGPKVKTNRLKWYSGGANLNLCWVYVCTEDGVARKNLLPAMFEIHHCYLKKSGPVYY